MASNLESYSAARQLTTTVTTSVSTADNESKFLGDIAYTNTSLSRVEVTIWLLDGTIAATEGSGGNWLERRGIAPGKTWNVNPGKVLSPSMKWAAKADAGAVVNEFISGVTEV